MKRKREIFSDAVKLTLLIVSIIGIIIIMTGLESILESFGVPGIAISCLTMILLFFIVNWIYETEPGKFKRARH